MTQTASAEEVECPDDCGCRLGTDDFDAHECVCTGPCRPKPNAKALQQLKEHAQHARITWPRRTDLICRLELAADLLEMHDDCAISLDGWQSARTFVEMQTDVPLIENGI